GARGGRWGTASIKVVRGGIALWLSGARAAAPTAAPPHPGREPGERPSPALRNTALLLLGLTAFAALLDEIAWTRVLVMIVGGSTYAFTLVLLVFLLGIGIGSALVARRGAIPSETAAAAAGAQ